MINHQRHLRPSRREVQRRFPPGTFIMNEGGVIFATVIGWAQTPPEINPATGKICHAMGWEAILLRVHDNRLTRLSWSAMIEEMTVDEWMDWATRP